MDNYSRDGLWSATSLGLDCSDACSAVALEKLHQAIDSVAQSNADFCRHPSSAEECDDSFRIFLDHAIRRIREPGDRTEALNLYCAGLSSVSGKYATTRFSQAVEQKHACTPKQCRLLDKYVAFSEFVDQHLPDLTKSSLSFEGQVGFLIYSLVTRCAVLESRCIAALLLSLNQSIRVAPDFNWIEATYRQSSSGFVTRRIMLDPVTAYAMAQLSEEECAVWKEHLIKQELKSVRMLTKAAIWPALSQFFSELGVPVGIQPTSYITMMSWAKSYWCLTLPPVLYYIATGETATTSLPEEVWLRINKYDTAGMPDTGNQATALVDQQAPLKTPKRVEAHDELAELSRALKLHGSEQRNAIHALARATSDDPQQWSPKDWAVGFIDHQLRNGGSTGRRKKGSTVRTIFGHFGHRLLLAFHNRLIAQVDQSERAAKYEELLEDLSTSRKTAERLRVALRDFDAFVIKTLGQDLDPWNTRINMDESGFIASANLITPEEYHRLILETRSNRFRLSDQRLHKYCEVVCGLGFHTGMRRSEIHGLRTHDHHGDRLLVRANEFRGLKTGNSRRAVPLFLLERPIIGRLSALANRPNKKNEYIFSYEDVDNADKQPVIDYALFSPITEALARVTGDKSIHFHHLRHSCATWQFLLSMAEIVGLWDHADRSPLIENLMRYSSNKAAQLNAAQRVSGLTDTPSHLLGHASPSTTFKHYIHLSDLLIYAATSHLSPRPLSDQLACVSGMSAQTRLERDRSKANRSKKPKHPQDMLISQLRRSRTKRVAYYNHIESDVPYDPERKVVGMRQIEYVWKRRQDAPIAIKGTVAPIQLSKLNVRPPEQGLESELATHLLRSLNELSNSVPVAVVTEGLGPLLANHVASKQCARLSPSQARTAEAVLEKASGMKLKLSVVGGARGESKPTRGRNAAKPRYYRISIKGKSGKRTKSVRALYWVLFLFLLIRYPSLRSSADPQDKAE